MAFLHTCLQSLCEEARLVMRGYYLEEKPGFLSSFSCSPPSEILICLSNLCMYVPPVAFDRAGKHDATPSQGGCRGVLEQQWCFSVWLSLVIRPLPTLVQLGSTLEYFRYWLVAKHLHDNKPCVCPFVCV